MTDSFLTFPALSMEKFLRYTRKYSGAMVRDETDKEEEFPTAQLWSLFMDEERERMNQFEHIFQDDSSSKSSFWKNRDGKVSNKWSERNERKKERWWIDISLKWFQMERRQVSGTRLLLWFSSFHFMIVKMNTERESANNHQHFTSSGSIVCHFIFPPSLQSYFPILKVELFSSSPFLQIQNPSDLPFSRSPGYEESWIKSLVSSSLSPSSFSLFPHPWIQSQCSSDSLPTPYLISLPPPFFFCFSTDSSHWVIPLVVILSHSFESEK